jgi:hypothetical protein
MQHI